MCAFLRARRLEQISLRVALLRFGRKSSLRVRSHAVVNRFAAPQKKRASASQSPIPPASEGQPTIPLRQLPLEGCQDRTLSLERPFSSLLQAECQTLHARREKLRRKPWRKAVPALFPARVL